MATKRIFWAAMTALSYLMLGFTGWLLAISCQPRAEKKPSQPHHAGPVVDFARTGLEQRVQVRNNKLIITKNNAQTAVKSYENAAAKFDSTGIDLPEWSSPVRSHH